MKNLKSFILSLCFIGIVTFNYSCTKDKCESNGECNGEVGVFVKKQDCTLVVELENGTLLEDSGLRLWDVEVNACTPYCIVYAERPAATSTCEDVLVVELLEVKEL